MDIDGIKRSYDFLMKGTIGVFFQKEKGLDCSEAQECSEIFILLISQMGGFLTS